jgi:hypothetical protein
MPLSSMAAACSGAFAPVACPFKGFLLCLFGKRRWCRTWISVSGCRFVAFRAKHLGVIKPVAAAPSLVVDIEAPRSCTSCHIILLCGFRPFVRHRRGRGSFSTCPPWRTYSDSWRAHKRIPPWSGFGGILSRRIFFLTNGFPLGKNSYIKKHSKGRLRSPI